MNSDEPDSGHPPTDADRATPSRPGEPSAADASRLLARRIAGDEAVTPHAASPSHSRYRSRGDAGSRRRFWIAVAVVVSLLVTAAVFGAGYLAHTNKTRADRWEERSVLLESNIDQLNGLLVERSGMLDARTREVNRIAATVRKQETALRGSEADVVTLEQRQRALAAEKAQVEDERAALVVQSSALETVASAFVDCKDGLVQLLGYVLDEDYSSAEAIVSDVSTDCGYAESALSNYNATYP
jgi:hypothetical protein